MLAHLKEELCARMNDDEIWLMVVFLRHLPPKGSLGEPKVYGGN